MLTNPRDAFSGQSMSPNTIPFDMLGIYGFLLLCYSNFVPKTFDFNNAATLKTELGVRRGHWKFHRSIERVSLHIDVLL